MDTFDFPYHICKVNFPDSANRMQFGKSYEATAAPGAPDQRIFVLTFAGMQTFMNTDGSVDLTSVPQINYERLAAFYAAHGTYTTFIYPHSLYGNINVKFINPLQSPDPVPQGNGVQGPFEIQLREQP